MYNVRIHGRHGCLNWRPPYEVCDGRFIGLSASENMRCNSPYVCHKYIYCKLHKIIRDARRDISQYQYSWIQLRNQGPRHETRCASTRWSPRAAVLNTRLCVQQLTHRVQHKNCTGTEIFTSEGQDRCRLTTITRDQLIRHPYAYVISDYITSQGPAQQSDVFGHSEALVNL